MNAWQHAWSWITSSVDLKHMACVARGDAKNKGSQLLAEDVSTSPFTVLVPCFPPSTPFSPAQAPFNRKEETAHTEFSGLPQDLHMHRTKTKQCACHEASLHLNSEATYGCLVHKEAVVFLVSGEDSFFVEFASNKGAAIGEGQFQPGDLVRVSAMSCQHTTVPFAAYNKHFVEGMLQPQ